MYLNLSVDSSKLSTPGYDIIRADHPNDQKRGTVCLYFKENLILRRLDLPYIAQCLHCEVTIENKKGYIVVLYRSPSQTANEFHDFQYNFEKLLNQVKRFCSSFAVILGGFNARSKSWWSEDLTTNEGLVIDSLTTTYGLNQLIAYPTYLLLNSSSCIDLIFKDQRNLAIDSGVHPSLHSNCHHQITYCKFNLIINYPPSYNQQVWEYKKTDTTLIKNALTQVNWYFLFDKKMSMIKLKY